MHALTLPLFLAAPLPSPLSPQGGLLLRYKPSGTMETTPNAVPPRKALRVGAVEGEVDATDGTDANNGASGGAGMGAGAGSSGRGGGGGARPAAAAMAVDPATLTQEDHQAFRDKLKV